MNIRRILILSLLLCCCFVSFAQKFDNLALTPQMGWNSWNKFGCDINEEKIKGIADAFVKIGLKDMGYQYIILDDGWMGMHRDDQGNFVANPDKFPHGIKALADYIHSKGLKFGLYSCVGDSTCAGYPGSRGHEYQDALKFAEWGVDYLKFDWCYANMMNAYEAYKTMRDALHAANRPVLFSLCEWGDNQPWKWAKNVGHSWRTTGDINNCFNGSKDRYGVLEVLNNRDQSMLRRVAGPGHWNDMDMLEIGNGGLTHFEEETHFALWAILASPLILGNDLRNISPSTLDIIKNTDVIAVSQDKLGIQGFRYKIIQGSVEIWIRPLINDEWAVCFFNNSDQTVDLKYNWLGETIKDPDFNYAVTFTKNKIYKLRDLYTHKTIGTTSRMLSFKLAKNQSLMLKLYN